MFEKTIPWVVIYQVLKYPGWRIASCANAAIAQAEMLVSQPWGSTHFLPVLQTGLWMHKGGASATTPCLTQWCGTQLVAPTWPFPFHHPIYVARHVWGMGSWKESAIVKLWKASRGIGRLQCHGYPIAHTAGVSLDWKKPTDMLI